MGKKLKKIMICDEFDTTKIQKMEEEYIIGTKALCKKISKFFC